MTLKEIYHNKCKSPSDINEHLPVLATVSLHCYHITEFGVRNPTSTYAFLMGKPEKVISYDIIRHDEISTVEYLCPDNFEFVQASTLDVEIAETDFIFFDTHHTYKQLSKELQLHGNKSKKYLGFHDVFTFGTRDESEYSDQPQQIYGSGPGIMQAINEFIAENPHWKIDYRTDRNNGLLILRRVTP